MKTLSNLFRDRPQKPLQTALWWTEYVLRHSDEELKALRPLSVGQSWIVRRQLDVWAVIFIAFAVALGILFKIFSKLVQCLFCSKSSSLQPTKKLKIK